MSFIIEYARALDVYTFNINGKSGENTVRGCTNFTRQLPTLLSVIRLFFFVSRVDRWCANKRHLE